MARSSSMGSRNRMAQIYRQSPITGTDAEIANSHEINRQSAIKSVLVHCFFLAKFGYLKGAVSGVSRGKTEAQYHFATGGNQAAHCAPAQISAGGVALQRLITTSNELSLEVENLFGNTDDLPVRFNVSDSSAEGKGLCDAFIAACNEIVQKSRIPFNVVENIAPHVQNAYRTHKRQALVAFDTAIMFQRQELQRGNDLTITTRAQVIAILQAYRSTLMNSMDTHETVQGLLLHDVWMDYSHLQ
ncbi:MAG: hypothetical protein ABI878_06835 [Acidobacteriota bacterium]